MTNEKNTNAIIKSEARIIRGCGISARADFINKRIVMKKIDNGRVTTEDEKAICRKANMSTIVFV